MKSSNSVHDGVKYWGISKGPDKFYYYDKCAHCSTSDDKGVGKHKSMGLCRRCHARVKNSGDRPYGPLPTYVAEREYYDTRDDRKEKSQSRKDKIAAIMEMIEQRIHPKDIVEALTERGITVSERTVYRYKTKWEYKNY